MDAFFETDGYKPRKEKAKNDNQISLFWKESKMNTDKNKHGVYIPADLWEQLKAFCEKHYKELIEREEKWAFQKLAKYVSIASIILIATVKEWKAVRI